MKNTLLLLSLVLTGIFAFAQAPQAFKYQAVARDLNGNPVINQEILIKISILAGSLEGTVVYSEVHQTTTNSMGLLNLEVGNGTVETGNFTLIDWGNNAFFVKTEIDLSGGSNFVFMGTSQLLSVPFSLYSENGMPDGQNPGDMLYWNGTQWIEVNAGINGQVLTFSNGVPTWGGVQLPILNTSAVTNITAFTAYCGGNIASDGGSPVIGRGICWNTTPNPTISDFKVIAGSGAGNFLAQMTGLESSTQYYVRAFATNSAGTSYGQEMSFFTTAGAITLSTTAVTNITINSATSGGNIALNGGSPVTARGVCWNTAPYPTVANNKTTDGNGNGIFVSQLTGLTNNTQYYIRAYATNSLGTSYGNQFTFTTLSGIVTLTTAEVTEITATTAITGGEITNDGGSPVTARGVCWSTSQNPTIADSTTNDGSGTGVFVSSLTGLDPDTLYYVRAWATNGVGTYYGNEVIITTLPFICGDVVMYGGQNYNTVLIGTQCWFKENLNVGTMINGADEQTDNGTIEKYCYDNNPENCNVYGGLYQWDEMMGYNTAPGATGICPSGWHLSSDDEWTILSDYLSSQQEYWCGNSSIWIAKSLAATTNWTSSSGTLCAIGNDLLSNNASGFTGLPGGNRTTSGSYYRLNQQSTWWTSTEGSSTDAIFSHLYYQFQYLNFDGSNKGAGNSVRCLKNEPTTSQLTINPMIQEVNYTADTIFFEVTSNTFWTIEENVAWLSVLPISGTNNGILTVTYDENTASESRIGQITITTDGGNPSVYVTIIQTRFTTTCGQLIDSRDGQIYNTVQLGTQCWMEQNLNVGNKIAGLINQTNNGTIEKYCYDNSEANCDVYGGLYQWNEVMNYSTTPGTEGICPEGWHIPSDIEWTTLTDYVSSQADYLCNSNTDYIAKSLASTLYWWTWPNYLCSVGENLFTNNATGFAGLPCGYRSSNGLFNFLHFNTSWWTSSEYSSTTIVCRYLKSDYAIVPRSLLNDKAWGFPVRCLKDD